MSPPATSQPSQSVGGGSSSSSSSGNGRGGKSSFGAGGGRANKSTHRRQQRRPPKKKGNHHNHNHNHRGGRNSHGHNQHQHGRAQSNHNNADEKKVSAPKPQTREEKLACVKAFVASRRFESAANAMRSMGLMEDAILVNEFAKTLVDEAQYRTVLTFVESARGVCTWTPHSVINAMISTGHLNEALNCIEKYRLGASIEPQTIIEKILRKGDVRLALPHIKKFCLEHIYTPDALIEQCVQAMDWELAIELLRKSKQRSDFEAIAAKFPPESLIKGMIKGRDWFAALRYMKQFKYCDELMEDDDDLVEAFEKEPNKETVHSHGPLVTDLVRGLLGDRQLYTAMRCILKFRLQAQFPLETVLLAMVQTHQHQFAIRFAKLLRMQHVLDGDTRQRIHWERLQMLQKYRSLAAQLSNEMSEARKGNFPDLSRKAVYLGFMRTQGASPLKRANSDDSDDDDDEEDLLLPQRAAPQPRPARGMPPRYHPGVQRPMMVQMNMQMRMPYGSPVRAPYPGPPRPGAWPRGMPPPMMGRPPFPVMPRGMGMPPRGNVMTPPRSFPQPRPQSQPQPQPHPQPSAQASRRDGTSDAKKTENAKKKKKQSGPLIPVNVFFKK